MLFELSNPSDKITFEASDIKVACLCARMLSSQFGVINEDWQSSWIPAFHWSGVYEKIFWPKREKEIEEITKENTEEIKACFQSFYYWWFDEYKQYKKALELITDEDKKIEFMKHNEDTRSSMNAIVSKAWKYWWRNIL